MFHCQLRERRLVDESAQHALQLANDWRRFELVASLRIASNVGEENPLARGEDRLEEQITVALGRRDVAGRALERPQIKRLAMLALGKDSVVQPERKNHFEWDRSQRRKRSNRDAALRVLSAARFEVSDSRRDYLARRLERHRTDAQFRFANRLDCFEEAVPDLLIDRALGPDVCTHEFAQHQRPFARRQVRIADRDRVGDQRPRHAHESRGRLEFILRDFARQVAGSGCSSRIKCGIAAALTGHHGAEREAFDRLIPMVEAGRDVGVLEIVIVGAEENSQRLAPTPPLLDIDSAFAFVVQRGMRQQPDHFRAREAAARQLEKQIDGFGDAARAGDAAADEIDRNSVLLSKDAVDLRDVVVNRRVGNQHGDFVKANSLGVALGGKFFVAANDRPDFVRDDFGFASNSRASKKADSRSPIGLPLPSSTLRGLRFAIEDVLLKLLEHRRCFAFAGNRIGKERREIALRQFVEQPDVFTARPPPEPESRRVGRSIQRERVFGFSEFVADFVLPMSPSSQRAAARGVHVFPKLAARIERVDPNVAERAESRENIRISISGVRGTEHVKRVGQGSLELPVFVASNASGSIISRVSRCRSHSSRTRPCESNTNCHKCRCHRSVSLIASMSDRRAARHFPIMRRREIEYSRNSRANCAASRSVLSSTSASVFDPPWM